jgi:hypothetical protein
MLSEKEISMLYETLLSSPGMSEKVKLSITITRKNALILCNLIDQGITGGNEGNKLFAASGMDAVEMLQAISLDILSKSGLSELNERLKVLNGK